MTTAPNNTASISAVTLTALRTLTEQPPQSLTDLLHAADQQAKLLHNLLHNLLPSTPGHILERLTRLIPTIQIDYVDTMPVPGIAFWGNGTWHIHIRADNPIDVQLFAGLHELKHIIDHPLRRQRPELLSDSAWEGVADHFATEVLAGESTHTTTQHHDPTGRQHVSLRSTTRKGGSL
jgi:hypothetical protein